MGLATTSRMRRTRAPNGLHLAAAAEALTAIEPNATPQGPRRTCGSKRRKGSLSRRQTFSPGAAATRKTTFLAPRGGLWGAVCLGRLGVYAPTPFKVRFI